MRGIDPDIKIKERPLVLVCPKKTKNNCNCIEEYICSGLNGQDFEGSGKIERRKELLSLNILSTSMRETSFLNLCTSQDSLKSLGSGRKKPKEYVEFILGKRLILRSLGLCEGASKYILGYSNNLIHRRLKYDRENRNELTQNFRQKGTRSLGKLAPLDEISSLDCCKNSCTKLAQRYPSLVKCWRDRVLQQRQNETRRVVYEMLIPNSNLSRNCTKFIEIVTGCCRNTVRKIFRFMNPKENFTCGESSLSDLFITKANLPRKKVKKPKRTKLTNVREEKNKYSDKFLSGEPVSKYPLSELLTEGSNPKSSEVLECFKDVNSNIKSLIPDVMPKTSASTAIQNKTDRGMGQQYYTINGNTVNCGVTVNQNILIGNNNSFITPSVIEVQASLPISIPSIAQSSPNIILINNSHGIQAYSSSMPSYCIVSTGNSISPSAEIFSNNNIIYNSLPQVVYSTVYSNSSMNACQQVDMDDPSKFYLVNNQAVVSQNANTDIFSHNSFIKNS